MGWRASTQSVTLTWTTLIIRNFFETKRAPLTNIAWVGFRQGRLSVTVARGTRPSEQAATGAHAAGYRERIRVSAVGLGPSYWSGLRGRADEIGDTIAAAAGLPPLPPRKPIIPRNLALAMLPVGAVLFGPGAYLESQDSSNTNLPLPLLMLGAALGPIGLFTLVIAASVTIDHWRKRRQGPR